MCIRLFLIPPPRQGDSCEDHLVQTGVSSTPGGTFYGIIRGETQTSAGASNTVARSTRKLDWSNRLMNDSTTLRICRKCGIEKPSTPEYFVRNKAKRGGLETVCHECNRARVSQWQKDNPDKVQARNGRYAERHPEKIKEIRQISNSKNRNRKHKPKTSLQSKTSWAKYVKNHPERIKTIKRVNQQKRESLKNNLPSTFTVADWQRCLEYWENRCAICGRPQGLWHILAMDHWIPLSAIDCPGTVAVNMIPLCHGEGGCNNSKSNKTPIEWLTTRYGNRKAKTLLQRIADYFNSLTE